MSASAFSIVFIVSAISLLHAAYSAAQHRTYLRISQQEFTSLPIDILIQSIVSLFSAMYSIIYLAGDLKEIRATTELEGKSWETLRNIPSFYSINHRGKAMFATNDFES